MEWLRRVVVAGFATLAMAAPVLPAGPVHAVPTPSSPAVKYYVVGQPVDGQRESLYAIAAKTLGNGNRHPEIFSLNKDVQQADGGRLTDPMVLTPGWILVLPPDASGPGVRRGQIPFAGGSPSTLKAPKAASPNPLSAPLVEATGICVAVVLFGAAVAVLRGGRRPVPAPLPAGRLSGGPVSGRAGAPDQTVQMEQVRSVPQLSMPGATSVSPQTSARPPAPPGGFSPPVPTPPATSPPAQGAASLPEPRDAGNPHELVAELRADGLALEVSLNGVRGDEPGPPFGWRGAGQAPPLATLPVVLGEQQAGRRLFADLARCPDVLTVLGAGPDCQRYALQLIRQVIGMGNEVTVLGDLFGVALPAGCRRIAAMSDMEASAAPGIVVCGRLTGSALQAARQLRVSGGTVPIVLGEVAPSRWWVRVVDSARADRDDPV
ncbi:LysM peptidoglycan-binding domain-containing protein [Dactylosporangium sp. CA-233914]|uniref:LysM peptidoglycan-binding domain-containing protein n=1 Tax=Dactylosporangium sp. CA-233914 TaxID=3239934 RepID=UPI003D8CAAD8